MHLGLPIVPLNCSKLWGNFVQSFDSSENCSLLSATVLVANPFIVYELGSLLRKWMSLSALWFSICVLKEKVCLSTGTCETKLILYIMYFGLWCTVVHRESAGSYDTCPYWSICSLDNIMRSLSPDRILVRISHLLSCYSSVSQSIAFICFFCLFSQCLM